MPKLRLQYQRRAVEKYDNQLARPLDIEVPEGASVEVLDVNSVGYEYVIDFVVISPMEDEPQSA